MTSRGRGRGTIEGINNCDSFINKLRIRVKNTKVYQTIQLNIAYVQYAYS